MKKKFSLFLNIASICLCICAIAIGVWSAKRAELAVNGNIGFTANHCNANVQLKIEHAALGAQQPATPVLYVQNDGGLAVDPDYIEIAGQDKTVEIPDIYYSDMPDLDTPEDIVFTFSVVNTSNFPIVAYLELDSSILRTNSDILATWDIMGGTIMKEQTLNITLTLNLNTTQSFASSIALEDVINLTLEKAASGKYENYTVATTCQTFDDEGNVTGSENISQTGGYYITSVPAKTTNDTLVIPAVLQKNDGSYIQIEGVGGATEYFDVSTLSELSYQSNITSTVNKPVANIDNYTKVVVSNGITTICDVALACGNFGIDDLFYNEGPTGASDRAAGWVAYANSITSFELSKTLTTFYADSFECAQGYALNIPNSLKELPDFLDEGIAPSLTSITLGYGLKSASFFGCNNLTYAFIPGSISDVPSFHHCISLNEVILDDGVQRIYVDGFEFCASVDVILPLSVTCLTANNSAPTDATFTFQTLEHFYACELDEGAFNDNYIGVGYAWGSLDCLEGVLPLQASGEYVVPYGVTEIRMASFFGNTSLDSVVLPETVVRIESNAFEASGLTNINIPQNLNYIAEGAFAYMEELTLTGSLSGWKMDGEPIEGDLTGEILGRSYGCVFTR